MPTPERLLNSWTWTSTALELPPAPELGERILARYSEPHRVFHTAGHLADVLDVLTFTDAVPLLALAAWFHDAIYVPGRPDNESRSAALAREDLGAWGLAASSITFVSDAILATATHTTSDPRIAALLDADMTILAAPARAYDRYVNAIRHEYQAVPPSTFTAGRRAFLSGPLARDHIFSTPAARTRFEPLAVSNLRRELAGLETRAVAQR